MRWPGPWVWLLMAGLIGLGPIAAAAQAESAAPVRFMVTESATMPLALIERDAGGVPRLVDGILLDWQRALAKGLGRPAEYVVIPRRREDIAMASTKSDIRCAMSPEWIPTEARDDYFWPAPWLHVREVLVGPPGTAAIRDESAFKGQRVGTVAGYHYPSLEPHFASGRLARDDAPTEAAALGKLQRGHLRLTIMREMDLRYLLQGSMKGAALESSTLVINDVPMHCGLARKGSVRLDRFEAVQQQLIQSGVLQQIARRYLGNSAANDAFAGPRPKP